MTLGERLRELREHELPAPVTQATIAQALGVSSQLVSNWETGKQLPPPKRLDHYALFFASARSLSSEGAQLLDLASLTEEEEARRLALVAELAALGREFAETAAAGQASPGSATQGAERAENKASGSNSAAQGLPGFWQFQDDRRVVLIASRNPSSAIGAVRAAEPRHPDFQRTLLMADADAVMELYGVIKAHNPETTVDIVLHDQVQDGDFSDHVVIIGGSGVNEYTI